MGQNQAISRGPTPYRLQSCAPITKTAAPEPFPSSRQGTSRPNKQWSPITCRALPPRLPRSACSPWGAQRFGMRLVDNADSYSNGPGDPVGGGPGCRAVRARRQAVSSSQPAEARAVRSGPYAAGDRRRGVEPVRAPGDLDDHRGREPRAVFTASTGSRSCSRFENQGAVHAHPDVPVGAAAGGSLRRQLGRHRPAPARSPATTPRVRRKDRLAAAIATRVLDLSPLFGLAASSTQRPGTKISRAVRMHAGKTCVS